MLSGSVARIAWVIVVFARVISKLRVCLTFDISLVYESIIN
jgi:hypothetical protein